MKPFIQKKYSHSRQYGSRINPVTISIALLLATICYIIPTDYGTEVYMQPNDLMLKEKVVETRLTKSDIENKIRAYFPRSYADMIPIAYAESRMNPKAVGYNCYYNKDETIVYSTKVKGSHSTGCKPSHRKYSWSLDCGLMQMNTKAKTCPVETIDEHLQRAANLSRVQGKEAWVAYNTKAHLTYK